jgi:hypothetical protein
MRGDVPHLPTKPLTLCDFGAAESASSSLSRFFCPAFSRGRKAVAIPVGEQLNLLQ